MFIFPILNADKCLRFGRQATAAEVKKYLPRIQKNFPGVEVNSDLVYVISPQPFLSFKRVWPPSRFLKQPLKCFWTATLEYWADYGNAINKIKASGKSQSAFIIQRNKDAILETAEPFILYPKHSMTEQRICGKTTINREFHVPMTSTI